MFDDLIASGQPVQIPLAGHSKSLLSLKVRVADGLKWLADKWANESVEAFKPYADLKRNVAFEAGTLDGQEVLIVRLRRPINYRRVTLKEVEKMGRILSHKPSLEFMLAETIKTMMGRVVENSSCCPERRLETAQWIVAELSDPAIAEEMRQRGINVEAVLAKARLVLDDSVSKAEFST